MLLHDARRAARTGRAGDLVPLEEQDRARWDASEIDEGVARAGGRRCGRGQRRAVPAAGRDRGLPRDRGRTAADTDWPQIARLYGGWRG